MPPAVSVHPIRLGRATTSIPSGEDTPSGRHGVRRPCEGIQETKGPTRLEEETMQVRCRVDEWNNAFALLCTTRMLRGMGKRERIGQTLGVGLESEDCHKIDGKSSTIGTLKTHAIHLETRRMTSLGLV